MNDAVATPGVGAWSPLRQPVFRALWLAILASNVGTWIHEVAAAWLMTGMSASPLMVAAVQTATTLPVVLLALIAGTLADIVDRRRYLILAQLWLLLVASTLAVLAHLQWLGPWSLLLLTFGLGVGAALTMPAQAAITPELVPRTMLAPAVALNSVAMNIARAIGPAVGGLIVARFGVEWAFALNALSFLAVVVVLWRWRRAPGSSTLPPEQFGSAFGGGLRFARQALVFRAVLVKAALFFVFASAATALLPVLVRTQLQAGPGTFGVLLGFLGVGALLGAAALPRLRQRHDRDRLVFVATLVYAAGTLALAWLRVLPLLCVTTLVMGFAWISVLSSLQIGAQLSVPAWVRARALSLYIMVFAAGMAAGSLIWGALAQATSITVALLVAGGLLALAALLALRFRLGAAESLDVMPSAHWPEPVVADAIDHDRGPVLITVEYRIDAGDRHAFLDLMRVLGRARRRDGALQWGVFEDTMQPGLWQESFLSASWLDHLRQHERVTGEEQRLQRAIAQLHRDDAAPVVRHFVAASRHGPVPPHRHASPEAHGHPHPS